MGQIIQSCLKGVQCYPEQACKNCLSLDKGRIKKKKKKKDLSNSIIKDAKLERVLLRRIWERNSLGFIEFERDPELTSLINKGKEEERRE